MKAQPRFGPAGTPVGVKGGTLEGIKYVASEKLDAFECQFVRGVKMKIYLAKEVGKVAKESNVLLSAHAPYFINLASEEKIKLKKSINWLIQTARISHSMGASNIVFHPAYYGKSKEHAVEITKEALRQTVREIRDEGIKDVFLAPETTGRQSQVGTLEEIISFCEEIDGVIPTVDFAHIHARTDGGLKTQADFANIFDLIEKRLGAEAIRNLHSHFTEVFFKKGNEKHHLVLGSNGPKFDLLAREIVERGISPTIISESPILDKDSLKMKVIFEKLLK
ncbi:MAG: TIM barrel protein [Euryarchaeota archaeon]|nr:TIM barrel protein [Euryarchaeota archaeon]